MKNILYTIILLLLSTNLLADSFDKEIKEIAYKIRMTPEYNEGNVNQTVILEKTENYIVLRNEEVVARLVPFNSKHIHSFLPKVYREPWGEYCKSLDKRISIDFIEDAGIINNHTMLLVCLTENEANYQLMYVMCKDPKWQKGQMCEKHRKYQLGRPTWSIPSNEYLKKKFSLNSKTEVSTDKKQNIDEYKETCIKIGFKENTEKLGECVLKLIDLSQKKNSSSNETTSSNNQNKLQDELLRSQIEKEKQYQSDRKLEGWQEILQSIDSLGNESHQSSPTKRDLTCVNQCIASGKLLTYCNSFCEY